MTANKHGAVAVRNLEDDSVTVHAAAACANYGTLCGLSTDDDCFQTEPTPERARINCAHCHDAWTTARQYRSANFAPANQRKNP